MVKKNLLKKISSFLLGVTLLSLVSSFASAQENTSFYDIPTNHPQFKAIENLKRAGVLDGYSDGSFRPDQIVNRVEALKMILNGKKISLLNPIIKTNFNDIKIADWFSPYIETAKSLNIVSGNPDGSFAPDRAVNKVEFLKMLLLAFEIKFVNYQPPSKPLYGDVQNNQEWYIRYLDFAKSINLITQNNAGNIEPAKNLTRAEVAEIIYKLMIVTEGGPTQLLLSRAEANLLQAVFDIKANNLSEAKLNIQNAKSLVLRAFEKNPDDNEVKTHSKIVEAFEKLLQAHQESEKNKAEAIKTAGTAYNLAEEAQNIDQSLEKLALLAKIRAKTLADHLRT